MTGRPRFDRDLSDELRDHLDRRTADLIRAGLSADEARRRAHVEFGGVEAYKEQIRDGRGWAVALRNLPEQLWRDAVLAARRLRATPVYTTFAIVSLAVGVGVTTSVYAVLGATLWQPSGIPGPDRIAVLTHTEPQIGPLWQGVTSRLDFEDLRGMQRSLAPLAASNRFVLVIADDSLTESILGEAVTGDYFRALGVPAALGRVLLPADDRANADSAVVIAHRFWHAKLGADPAVVGHSVRIGGRPFVIVGVAPESFRGLNGVVGFETDAWIAIGMLPRPGGAVSPAGGRNRPELSVFGRLRPGRRVDEVAAEFRTAGVSLDAASPILRHAASDGPALPVPRLWSSRTLMEAGADLSGRTALVGGIVIGLVSLVLVVACTNLANLALGRGAARQSELAVRRALGASRGRLVRELSVESGLLALCGGIGALIVTRGLLALFSVEIPVARGRIIQIDPQLNLPALAVAAGALLLSLAVFGLVPALQLTRASLRARMASGPADRGLLRWRVRRSLISWQVAISAGLFLIAALSLKVLAIATLHDSGIDLDHLAVGGVSFYAQQWDESRGRRAIAAVLEHSAELGGADAVALSSGVPFGSSATRLARVTSPERPFAAGGHEPYAYLLAATPEIFRVLDVPITRGRALDQRDAPGAPEVVVVSEQTARSVFTTTDVVGRRLLLRGVTTADRTPRTLEIVGVARDTDAGNYFGTDDSGVVYVPLAQRYESELFLLARAKVDPAAVAAGMSTMVRRADPDLAVTAATTGRSILTGAHVVLRPAVMLAGGLATTAMVLAMCGLYGVLSHLVSQRTREMGIRMALGAEASRIRRLVLRDGLRPVVVGILLGLGIGWAGRLVFRAIFVTSGISIIDPVAFSLVPIPLVVAGFLACYLPARRASRVDPNVALRDL